MAKVQFFSQRMIDQWVAEKMVDFDGETLKVLVGKKGHFALQPATMFVDVIDGSDQQKLKGKVLTVEHLTSIKADVYRDSAIVGEVAYRVEPGFVVATAESVKHEAHQPLAPPIAAANPTQPAAGAAAATVDAKQSGGDPSLADLFLKSISGKS